MSAIIAQMNMPAMVNDRSARTNAPRNAPAISSATNSAEITAKTMER